MPAATKHIGINPHRCTACWPCVEACPQEVIGKLDFLFHKHSRIENPDDCMGCQKCVRKCPNQAIFELVIDSNPEAFRFGPKRRQQDWQKHIIDLMQ